jgi:hypothetical protein
LIYRILFLSPQKAKSARKRKVRYMKSFEVHFRYRDRNEETVQSKLKVEASSLPGGIAKATREFVKSLDRKQRFDMNKNGLEITAHNLGASESSSEAAGSAKTSATSA